MRHQEVKIKKLQCKNENGSVLNPEFSFYWEFLLFIPILLLFLLGRFILYRFKKIEMKYITCLGLITLMIDRIGIGYFLSISIDKNGRDERKIFHLPCTSTWNRTMNENMICTCVFCSIYSPNSRIPWVASRNTWSERSGNITERILQFSNSLCA